MKKSIRNILSNLARFLNKAKNQRGAILGGFITIISCSLFLFYIRTPGHGEIVSIESATHPVISTTPDISPTKWWIKSTPTLPSFGSKTSTPSQPAKINCTQSPSSLQPGIYAYISLTPPLPNRIRSGAGQGYSYLGQIEPGDGVKIIDGPLCADGFRWWLVASSEGELRGWTPEGRNSEQWVIPCPDRMVTCTQELTPTLAVSKDRNAIDNNQCNSEKLSLGIFAHVEQDNLLTIRSEPNTGNVIGHAGPLSVVKIIGGPICTGDIVWWGVKVTALNLSGWATENNLFNCTKEDKCQ